MTNLLDHLRPQTLARLIAELIDDHAVRGVHAVHGDHADEMDTGEFNFHTEDAKNAYADLLAAGIRNCGEDTFFNLLDIEVN